MKKQLLVLSAIISLGGHSYGQQDPFEGISSAKMGGRTGISFRSESLNNWDRGTFFSNVIWNDTTKRWESSSSSLFRDFGMIRFKNGSEIGFYSGNPGKQNDKLSITNAEMNKYEWMSITNNGYVGIGTTNPKYKLDVNGTIHAREVKVDLSFPADYVFEKYYTGASTLKADYSMPTLEEIEAFTKENNHLPNIPSAKEIQTEGLHLKEMTNLLLQKIEELTLYTIEQEKKIKTLEEKVTNLDRK